MKLDIRFLSKELVTKSKKYKHVSKQLKTLLLKRVSKYIFKEAG